METPKDGQQRVMCFITRWFDPAWSMQCRPVESSRVCVISLCNGSHCGDICFLSIYVNSCPSVALFNFFFCCSHYVYLFAVALSIISFFYTYVFQFVDTYS